MLIYYAPTSCTQKANLMRKGEQFIYTATVTAQVAAVTPFWKTSISFRFHIRSFSTSVFQVSYTILLVAHSDQLPLWIIFLVAHSNQLPLWIIKQGLQIRTQAVNLLCKSTQDLPARLCFLYMPFIYLFDEIYMLFKYWYYHVESHTQAPPLIQIFPCTMPM
jgi:hypothetical protein